MKARRFIQCKQEAWAQRHNIETVGSQIDRGEKMYVKELEQNFFLPLSDKVIASFNDGDGGELKRKGKKLPKIQALHSSSALGVNLFQYWQEDGKLNEIAAACGFCDVKNTKLGELSFEQKFTINDAFGKKPNVDVVFQNAADNNSQVYAIECKFSEAYSSRKHSGLKEKYLTELDDIWSDIPNLHQLAREISPDDTQYNFLHAAQLVKHILGLKKAYGKKKFRLMYLWYDAFGEEGYLHRQEIERFEQVAKADEIAFHARSYQELILEICRKYSVGHEEYVNYITDRYL